VVVVVVVVVVGAVVVVTVAVGVGVWKGSPIVAMILRPYQMGALRRLREVVRDGARRVLLVAPTGSGKTCVAVSSIQASLAASKRVLVLAHRKELLDQFYGALYRENISAGLIRADDSRTDPGAPVQLASVASLVRRDRPEADVVWIDEAHRTPGESYQRILESYPRAWIIGLTATPCRLDGKPLREHFDAMIEVARYSELIYAGHILAPRVFAARRAVDLSGVKRVAGDYHEGQLEAAMMRPHVVGDVIAEWEQHAEGRSTVVFAVGIAHSKALAEEFRAKGIPVAHLDASSSEDERAQVLLDLETGRIRVVCNVGILCEGWDQPRVKCCVMARPTLSLTLHMQCVGRILRPWGDQCPIVLDHAGNTERHGLPHEDRAWSLTDGTAQRAGASFRVCPGCFSYCQKNPCEHCGFEKMSKPREVRTEPGVLELVGAAARGEPSSPEPQSPEPQSPERTFFDKQSDKCRTLGWKPGAAGARYKEKYGAWPPWSWSEKLQAEFAIDTEWQQRQVAREAQRAFWLAKNAARLHDVEMLPETDSGDETFSAEDL
jgi:DNA repair protein RadD